MQVGLTYEGTTKQRTLVPKQLVGLTALLLTGASATPINLHSVQMTNIPIEQNIESRATTEPLIQPSSTSEQSSPGIVEPEMGQMRENIRSAVLSWVGAPYQWGGTTKQGIDCSGLVQQVFRQNQVELPRTSYEQFKVGIGIPKAHLQTGDLIFFNTNGAGASHVGIYLGEGSFVSASKNIVEISSIDDPYWEKTYRGSRRVIT